MKNPYIILTLVCLSITIGAMSQPILTSANSNPQIGESFTGNSINYTNPGNGGANQIWDFSALTSGGIQTFSFIDPSTTSNALSFPNATIATFNSAAATYNYYSASTSAISIEGYVYGPPSNLKIPYSDPQTILSYPFTMSSNLIDTYSGTYTSGTNTIIRKGTNSVTADGYGTLILPYGTLNNVLRVTVIDDYADTIPPSTPYSHFTFNTTNWYLPGIHYQVMSLTSLYMNGGTTPVSQFGSYLDQTSVGIAENNLLNTAITIYPNPATEKLVIHSSEKIKKVNCLNYLGQTVSVKFENNSIDISTLSKGIYFLSIISENGRNDIQKFIKE